MLAFRPRPTMLLILLAALIGGCSDQPAVVQYEAPHGETDRMLAAILPGEDEYWYFKVAGPRAAITEHEADFRSFLSSVELDDSGEPTWKLPSGWLQQDGKGTSRFKTLVINASPESLELSVTKLPAPAADATDEYLTMNVNRWRGQMTLSLEAQITSPEIRDYLQPLSTDSNIQLVDLYGRYKPRRSGGMAAPMAPHAGGPPQQPARPEKPLEYKVPEGWKQGELVLSRGGISIKREAAFVVEKDGVQAEISVTISRGSLQGNIARWMGQAGIQITDAADIDKAQQPTKVGGTDAVLVDIKGDKAAIVGVIANVNGFQWFFKLSGPAAVVDAERVRYREFLDSVVFP